MHGFLSPLPSWGFCLTLWLALNSGLPATRVPTQGRSKPGIHGGYFFLDGPASSLFAAEPPVPVSTKKHLQEVCVAATSTIAKSNILFIAVDDLRPQLGCYGKSFMETPNIDTLAQRGMLFERAYCMVPTCGASRASLMTGLRPHSTRFVSYTSRADEDASGITTLNQHFRNNDYITISLGKVFHAADDSIAGWSEKPWRPKTRDHHDQAAERRDIAQHKAKYPRRTKVRGKPYEVFEAADSTYRDHEVATRAIEQLKQFQNRDAPFFLAVGFYKPHLPFCAPKKYWDLYDFDSIQIPDNYRIPPNAPRLAVHQSSELRSYATIPPTGQVSTYQARKLIHGYYACVSFIDAQVGRLMAALEVTGLSKNTIVVLCGDHGWQLGEHGMWNKHSCFETSMHTPLIVYAPDTSATSTPTPGASKQGGRISALTEFIDIYPSLCELAEIDPPNHLQGSSFVPLLQDPTRPGKPQAVGRYRAGDTIRTNQYRFSEYHGLRSSELVAGRMLYDHNADADENNNLAGEKKHESTVKRLSSQLRAITPEVQP